MERQNLSSSEKKVSRQSPGKTLLTLMSVERKGWEEGSSEQKGSTP